MNIFKYKGLITSIKYYIATLFFTYGNESGKAK